VLRAHHISPNLTDEVYAYEDKEETEEEIEGKKMRNRKEIICR